ncbi:MAG: ABC transporter ATP-binding protein, partial [Elusimicrobia bacterium]|nr:ABC transporter ATP-binding protein [Elusimicrobiota bacterium]
MFRLYREMWRHGEGKRRALVLMMALLLGAHLVRLVGPFLAGRALDTLQTQGLNGLGAAAVWLALMFGCTPASWVLHGSGRVLERNTALHVRSSVLEGLLRRILVLPLSWHETQHSGATARRVEHSARALFDFTQMQFTYLRSAVLFVGPTVALWLISPIVGLAALTGLIVIGATTIAYDRPLMRLARAENES